jgi:predicted nucleotidyltransferase
MINRSYILQFLRINKVFFKDKYNVVKIGIFGSYSREEQTENSDIDIIVEFDENTTDLFDKKYDLREFLKTELKKNIDLCREGAIKPLFKPMILKDAIYV